MGSDVLSANKGAMFYLRPPEAPLTYVSPNNDSVFILMVINLFILEFFNLIEMVLFSNISYLKKTK